MRFCAPPGSRTLTYTQHPYTPLLKSPSAHYSRRRKADHRFRARRAAFNVPADIAYFNTANLAPQLHAVRAAGEAALERRGQPWTIAAGGLVRRRRAPARRCSAQLVGADAEGVALVPATSYGFAVAARNLPLRRRRAGARPRRGVPVGHLHLARGGAARGRGDRSPSTREPGQTWTEAVLAALDERVAIVSVPNVHWTDGALVDLGRDRDAQPRARRAPGGRRQPVARRDAARRRRAAAGLRGHGRLQVAARPVRARLPLCRRRSTARRAARGELDRCARAPTTSPRSSTTATSTSPGAPLRRRPAHEVRAGRRWRSPRSSRSSSGSVPRDRGDPRRAAPPTIADGRPSSASIRCPTTSAARTCSACASRRRCARGVAAGARRANCFAAVRGASLRIAPHLHTTDEDVARLIDALATTLRAADPAEGALPARAGQAPVSSPFEAPTADRGY